MECIAVSASLAVGALLFVCSRRIFHLRHVVAGMSIPGMDC